jgi:hypothetical protein
VMQYERPLGATLRNVAAALRKGLERVALMWFYQMMPAHFAFGAHSEYGYEPRSRVYEIRKAKRTGKRNPLEFSGETRRMLAGQKPQPQTTRSGVALRLRVPEHFTQRRRGQPNLPAELKRVSLREAVALRDKALVRGMNEYLQGAARTRQTTRG